MPEGSAPQMLTILVFLILSAFFSASETSLMTISKLKLRNMIDSGVKGANTVEKITSNPTKLLGTILVGNNLVNIALSSIATALVISVFGYNGTFITITTIVLTIVILIFAEITPKSLAAKSPEKTSILVAKPISFLLVIFTPVVIILNVITDFIIKLFGSQNNNIQPVITENELKTMVHVSHEEGVIEESEKKMINNVFNFGDSKAVDVMTPRTNIVSVSIDADYDEIVSIFKEEQFSRIIVYTEDIDHIVGIINFKDFIFSDFNSDNFDIKKVMREPFFSYESKLTSSLFTEMKRNNTYLAIILDEYGGTLGIVSMEDLVEEIVGDITDEYDVENEEIIMVSENEYLVQGITKIEDFNDKFKKTLTSEEFESIGGFVMELLGAIPEKGDDVSFEDIKFVVEEMDKNRVALIRIYLKNKTNDAS